MSNFWERRQTVLLKWYRWSRWFNVAFFFLLITMSIQSLFTFFLFLALSCFSFANEIAVYVSVAVTFSYLQIIVTDAYDHWAVTRQLMIVTKSTLDRYYAISSCYRESKSSKTFARVQSSGLPFKEFSRVKLRRQTREHISNRISIWRWTPNMQSHQQVTAARFSQRHGKKNNFNICINRKFYEKLCCIAIPLHTSCFQLSTNTTE